MLKRALYEMKWHLLALVFNRIRKCVCRPTCEHNRLYLSLNLVISGDLHLFSCMACLVVAE